MNFGYKTTEKQRMNNKIYHARMKIDSEYIRKRRERARDFYHRNKKVQEQNLNKDLRVAEITILE